MADARARLAADAGEFEHVGARLAALREGRGLSLRDAAARTHIRENHLAAIEAADRNGLPARPYALGFVRTYAEFLEIDPRPVVEQFKLDAGYDAPQPVPAEKFHPAADAAETDGRDMSLPVFIAIIAFIIWCAWQITLTSKVTPLGEHYREAAPAPVRTPVPEPIQGEVVDPRILEQVEPVYPYSCAPGARAVETVTVAFTVTSAGRIAAERIANSTNACFDEAAMNALRRWRFEPRKVDGAAKPAYDQVQVFRFERP